MFLPRREKGESISGMREETIKAIEKIRGLETEGTKIMTKNNPITKCVLESIESYIPLFETDIMSIVESIYPTI